VGGITLMTHFANADSAPGVAEPLRIFERITNKAALPRTLANSAAMLRYPESHADWIRPGIALYGCSPFAESVGSELGLRPAMTLASELIAVREIAPGDAVGYGSTYVADRRSRIGIVACGYADGYPRTAPDSTPVAVDDVQVPLVGRVSMDMITVDLSSLPQAGIGSRVELWGAQVPIDEVANRAGTVGYELMCALAPRVPVVEAG
jgi:alanine racemase